MSRDTFDLYIKKTIYYKNIHTHRTNDNQLLLVVNEKFENVEDGCEKLRTQNLRHGDEVFTSTNKRKRNGAASANSILGGRMSMRRSSELIFE